MSQVIDNKQLQRFELEKEGQIAFADYRMDKDILYITHVEAPVALRGTGAAGELMQGMMDILRSQPLNVVPVCSYAAAWLQRHAQ